MNKQTLVVIVGAVYLLVKQYETRTVLIGAGFVLCIIALKPLLALDAVEVRHQVTADPIDTDQLGDRHLLGEHRLLAIDGERVQWLQAAFDAG